MAIIENAFISALSGDVERSVELERLESASTD